MSDDRHALATAPLTVVGQLRAASNATLLCTLPDGRRCVYKPVAGERPLWDFPDGTLAARELAMAALAGHLGLTCVPSTVWRDEGPFGPGMCQAWVDEEASVALVDVVPAGAGPAGWVVAFAGQDQEGSEVELVHRDDAHLAQIAVLDLVANNADRKAGHLLAVQGGVAAIDHGVCFAAEPKLRTVLWGWAGRPLESVHPASTLPLLTILAEMRGSLPNDLARWLDPHEVAALESRIDALVNEGALPTPSPTWPAIPWPVF